LAKFIREPHTSKQVEGGELLLGKMKAPPRRER
jgi:hypothetical protein